MMRLGESNNLATDISTTSFFSGRSLQATDPTFKPDSIVHIYLVASDRDLLNNVDKYLRKNGILGMVDMSGRIRYVLDGRRGASLAAKNFSNYTQTVSLSFHDQLAENDALIDQLIDNVLRGYGFRTRLRGFALLKRMLQLSSRDPALLRPATKRLYPKISEEFRVSLQQIERNLRYLVQTLLADEEAASRQNLSSASKKFWLSQDEEGKPTVISTLEKLHHQVLREYKLKRAVKQNKGRVQ